MYPNKHFAYFCNASTLLILFAFSTPSWGQDRPNEISSYTASDVLEHLELAQQTISNVTIDCTWDSHMEGSPSSWEQQTFISDDLGRRRIISKRGRLLDDGTQEPPEELSTTDTIFDGEILAYTKFYPHQDRVGNPSKKGEKATGYNPVIISDAASPLVADLNSQRNPLEYIRNLAIPAVKNAIKQKNIVVYKSPGDIDKIDVVIGQSSKSDQSFVETVIRISPKKNWIIESFKSFSEKKLTREIKFEYTKQTDGLWVPNKGRDIHWGERSKEQSPFLNWGFVVIKAQFNDPEFDESVFDIKLKPDAAVSDTRYKVAYRAGSEGLVTSQLEKYAEEARKAAAASKVSLRRGPGFTKHKKGTNNLGKTFLIANVVMLLLSAAIFVLVRWKRQRENS